ncbi:MAG: IPT/TIG domain-containing protein [Acidobacteriia bacterium]|nr:IPT/TIG domain-containing protein [Terriglobia bacterium]
MGVSIALSGNTVLVAGSGFITATHGAFQESSTYNWVTRIDLAGRSHLNAVLNAASRSGGAIAPGELVIASGVGFSPDALVIFDGASVVPVSRSGTDLLAPSTLSGVATVQVTSGGVSTNSLTVPVVDAAPAIFTNQSSSVPGGIRNADGTLNSPGNPAARGSVITILGTGLGVRPEAVTVYFDGFASSALLYGAAPGSPGVFQMTAVVPPQVPVSGRVSVYLTAGQVASQVVTMAVK